MKAKLKIEDNKLIIEGLNINVDGNIELECSEEDLKELIEKKLAKPKKTGYERGLPRSRFWMINGEGIVKEGYTGEPCDPYTASLYDNANYYSDPVVAANNARADKLMRQLRRFAVEHREKALNWRDSKVFKCNIYYNNYNKQFGIDSWWSERAFGGIYFDSARTAQLAIDTFRDELIWYFTEYKDSL